MIPKVIHCCWFGGKALPAQVLECVESWKAHCPDYEIKIWTESEFDIQQNRFCSEAASVKKWAFVADYFRAWALFHHGGIYLDTDVVLKKNFDIFLSHKFFIGFEELTFLTSAVYGCEKEHPLAADILASFDNQSFFGENGEPNMSFTMPVRITNCVLKRYKFKRFYNRKYIFDDLTIYPEIVFSPIDYPSGVFRKSSKTYSVHLFDGSWVNNKKSIKHKRLQYYKKRIKRLIKKTLILLFERRGRDSK